MLDDHGADAHLESGVSVLSTVLNVIGLIVLFVVVFWIIGVVAVPGSSGAAAVGDGLHATIEFFATIIRSI